MAEKILFLIFLIPAMLGLAEIMHGIKMLILYPVKHCGKNVAVLVPENETFVSELFSAYEQLCWYGKRFAARVVVLDSLLDGENRRKCEQLAKRLKLEFCSDVGFKKMLTDGE